MRNSVEIYMRGASSPRTINAASPITINSAAISDTAAATDVAQHGSYDSSSASIYGSSYGSHVSWHSAWEFESDPPPSYDEALSSSNHLDTDNSQADGANSGHGAAAAGVEQPSAESAMVVQQGHALREDTDSGGTFIRVDGESSGDGQTTVDVVGQELDMIFGRYVSSSGTASSEEAESSEDSVHTAMSDDHDHRGCSIARSVGQSIGQVLGIVQPIQPSATPPRVAVRVGQDFPTHDYATYIERHNHDEQGFHEQSDSGSDHEQEDKHEDRQIGENASDMENFVEGIVEGRWTERDESLVLVPGLQIHMAQPVLSQDGGDQQASIMAADSEELSWTDRQFQQASFGGCVDVPANIPTVEPHDPRQRSLGNQVSPSIGYVDQALEYVANPTQLTQRPARYAAVPSCSRFFSVLTQYCGGENRRSNDDDRF